MIKNYNDYYRSYGIRRSLQMAAPRLNNMTQLTLPVSPVIHYLPQGTELGLPADDYLLHDQTGQIYSNVVTRMPDGVLGAPKMTQVSVNTMTQAYHRKYRRIRRVSDLQRSLRDKRAVIIENYAMIPHIYRYTANIYRPYYKWYNLQATLWHEAAAIAATSDREQFIECRLPTILPSRALLQKGEVKLSSRLMHLFPEAEALFILEIWKWLGPHRETSLLAGLNDNALSKINLIWIESGIWSVMNLGLLNSWRDPGKADDLHEDSHVPSTHAPGAMAPEQLRRWFLRYLMFIYEARTSQGGEAKPLVYQEEKTAAKAGNQEDGSDETPEEVKDEYHTLHVETAEGDTKRIVLAPDVDLDAVPDDFTAIDLAALREIDKSIMEDISALDSIAIDDELIEENAASMNDGDDGIPSPVPPDIDALLKTPLTKELSLEESVMAKADQLADMGLVSAAEYRRFQAISKAYKTLPNPYGGQGTIEDFMPIKPEHLEITETEIAKKIEGVVDPSMLKSTLIDYTEKYVTQVMPRDLVNAVMGAQRAGVAVTGYTVKEEKDAMNHYEVHSVQLTPVRGKPSMFHFRIPKVRNDGSYLDNGVRYAQVKQRIDKPIRKVSPSQVMFTSYYGKVSVTRSEKKKANYSAWLCNQLRARGMDMKDDSVTGMMLGDVYDSNNHVPRIYSILAMSFRNLNIRNYHLFFDFEHRQALAETDIPLKTLEKRGMVLAGFNSENHNLILVGTDNVFYERRISDKSGDVNLEPLGTVESMLDLDVSKMPHEVAEIKIFGKLVPVGIFLGYHLGYEGMLRHLGIKPVRTLGPTERAKSDPDTIVITFEDVKYVFERRDDYTSLILEGFAALNEILANHPSHLFEKKAIYFTVFQRMGLGQRYLREMDLLVDMFVDPIAREILAKMHEPVNFIDLVIRATQLLMTDWSKDEVDLDESLIRGYERFAGAVYSQLVQGIRHHRARGTATAAIEISPYAVRTAINQDGSIRLIEESNPIHELKTQEEVTFSGTGGRSGRALVGRNRVFHQNDTGIISEATKDSSAVAITTFLTANPLLTDLRGFTRRFDPAKDGASSLLSTSVLLAPVADRDD